LKTTWIIIGAAVVIILLIVRMITLLIAKDDALNKEFVSKLNYRFSAKVDSIALFNPNAPVGYIYIRSTTDSVVNKEKKISRLTREGRRMRFLDPARKNRFRMFSKDARLYKTGDSLYINTSEDRMQLFHDRALVREFTISKEVN
jgi:hypothetical protein